VFSPKLDKPKTNKNVRKVNSTGFCIIYKQKPPFGAEICSDNRPRALSVPRDEQFSESVARGKM